MGGRKLRVWGSARKEGPGGGRSCKEISIEFCTDSLPASSETSLREEIFALLNTLKAIFNGVESRALSDYLRSWRERQARKINGRSVKNSWALLLLLHVYFIPRLSNIRAQKKNEGKIQNINDNFCSFSISPFFLSRIAPKITNFLWILLKIQRLVARNFGDQCKPIKMGLKCCKIEKLFIKKFYSYQK